MSIREELKINGYQPVVGYPETGIGTIFRYWIEKHGFQNMIFICSPPLSPGACPGDKGGENQKKGGGA